MYGLSGTQSRGKRGEIKVKEEEKYIRIVKNQDPDEKYMRIAKNQDAKDEKYIRIVKNQENPKEEKFIRIVRNQEPKEEMFRGIVKRVPDSGDLADEMGDYAAQNYDYEYKQYGQKKVKRPQDTFRYVLVSIPKNQGD